MAHQAGAYPGFCSMKRLGVFLLPPGWDASPSRGYPPALNSPVPIYTPGWREALRVKYLAQEHNTMSPARARTRTACSRVERTNHEATALFQAISRLVWYGIDLFRLYILFSQYRSYLGYLILCLVYFRPAKCVVCVCNNRPKIGDISGFTKSIYGTDIRDKRKRKRNSVNFLTLKRHAH